MGNTIGRDLVHDGAVVSEALDEARDRRLWIVRLVFARHVDIVGRFVLRHVGERVPDAAEDLLARGAHRRSHHSRNV